MLFLAISFHKTISGQACRYTVVPGVGFSNFKIARTTFDDIIVELGQNYQIDTFYVNSSNSFIA